MFSEYSSMQQFCLKDVKSEYILDELANIGFDEGYRFTAQDKFNYKNIKIFNLNPAQANILKQTALSIGADCATHKEVIRGGIEKSDVIMCGSISQINKIAEKLKTQPFKLSVLGEEIIRHADIKKRKTKLAGILNVTPDSFSDGGEFFDPSNAIKHLVKMIEDGADLIDIGAESTRPFAKPVSYEEQVSRLKPIMKFIEKEQLQIPVSVDTRDSKVADFVLNSGVKIINDVSGFDYDKKMPAIIAQYNAGVIIQHSQGSPENMQISPAYKNLIDDIFLNLKSKIKLAKENGIQNIIADPGIGFGKTKENNFEIINRAEEFFGLGCPIMFGVSRKSLLGVTENDNTLKDTLTAAISYPLIQKGIDYLRVHNIKLHKYIIDLT